MNVRNWIIAKKTVLILGESGTGKSSFVKGLSKELGLSIVQININNISKDLVESELFGHVKGSFSGAVQDKKGLCEIVGNGILFIDEIGDLSLNVQKKLLMLLEEREYRKVGGLDLLNFKGTVVLATHHNLELLVKRNCFRLDLFYRLNTFSYKLLPIREMRKKKEIISSLINQKVYKKTLSKQLINTLMNYQWPGNYRELKNTLEYLEMLTESKIDVHHLPLYMKDNKTEVFSHGKTYREGLETFEAQFFKRALREYDYHITNCSKAIGLSKVTMISKVKKYNLTSFINKNKIEMNYGF